MNKLLHRAAEPARRREESPQIADVSGGPKVASRSAGSTLEIRAVSKTFEQSGYSTQAISNVSISVAAGQFVSIVGPSGCGKSTLLDIVAGLQIPTSGSVLINDQDVVGRAGVVGYMLQKDVLLPWRSALDNAMLGLEIQGMPRKRARHEALAWFPRFGLNGFEQHLPAMLSGGMRQRVSLLRTFLAHREILVLDEPFGALDALTRAQMQQWLIGIQDEFCKTVVLVTHDVDEALYLSDRIYVMSSRPGFIVHFIDVPLRRPRAYRDVVTSIEFMELKRTLLEALQSQVEECQI